MRGMQYNTFKCQKCEHQWKQKSGQGICHKCGHLYVKWVNYEERRAKGEV